VHARADRSSFSGENYSRTVVQGGDPMLTLDYLVRKTEKGVGTSVRVSLQR